ncbi:hypothetical protein [Acinetobacter larvae]|uniref:DUF2345 domain-containing protein n=1 Tax=Acinetobacter larvae TaxID=1789224 RepID=A0A1B2M166_9GAMM|nr:hypothetical protein [Acinetobacter larvae]AOA58901.1 hypothetical protein BFG52_11415 [Acinetobacter larvae]
MAGGSQIIIDENGITIITPRKFEVKAGQHVFEGGEKVNIPAIQLPVLGDTNKYNLRYLMKDKNGVIFSNHKYAAFLPNGNIVEGVTDDKGYTEFFETVQSDDIEIHLFKNEQIDIK